MEDNHPKISCIVITREPILNELILERLDLGFFDEILIIPECPSVYHRYKAAREVKSDIIYIQDDDCMVNYQVLFKSYNGRITNTMTLPFQDKYKASGCTLVGWGAFFPKEMLSVFDRYIEKYGAEDPHLLREADRIFTHLNQPWNTVIQPHEDLKVASDVGRMCYEESHYKSMAEALEKCKAL